MSAPPSLPMRCYSLGHGRSTSVWLPCRITRAFNTLVRLLAHLDNWLAHQQHVVSKLVEHTSDYDEAFRELLTLERFRFNAELNQLRYDC